MAANGRRLLVVGLDGADWQAIDPLVKAGRLPAFARIRAAGRTGTLLATPPLVSPILWTTIATGRRPEDHRVLDFMVDLPDGGQAPVPSSERAVAALWNVFSGAGRSVAVLGWWASWPAEEVNGTIVSDRVAPQLLRNEGTLDPRAISPASRSAELTRHVVRASQLTEKDLAAYVPATPAEMRAASEALRQQDGRLYRNPLAHLAAIIAGTRTYAAMAEAQMASRQPDLMLVYLELIDSVSHRFVKDALRGPGAIARAYEDADAVIGRLARLAAPETWLVLVSDHGFYTADAGVVEDPADLEGPASAWHRPYGIVAAVAAGEIAAARATGSARDAGTVTPLDVAPTLLHAAGLPVSRELPGRVQTALEPPDAAARAIERVATFERPRTGGQASQARDDAALERLQALGYVGARTSSLARRNLGEILYRRGDFAGAERELRAVAEVQPKNAAALGWLAKAIAAQGRSRAALDVYARVLALPDEPGEALVAAVDLAAAAKLPDEALRMIEACGERCRTTAAGHTARAVSARLQGREDAAERELRSALAVDRACLPALEKLVEFLGQGRAGDAVPLLRRAVELTPRSARHQALLGLALLAAGDARGAEQRLALAVDLAPDGASARVELARAQLVQGRTDVALATLAAPALASSSEAAGLRGAAHARRNEWKQAADAYAAALELGPAETGILNALAWARVQLGQRGDAARLLRQSLSLQSDQPAIRTLLAQVERGQP